MMFHPVFPLSEFNADKTMMTAVEQLVYELEWKFFVHAMQHSSKTETWFGGYHVPFSKALYLRSSGKC